MKRKIGDSDIEVTTVAMGCWPISGMTSIGVTKKESQATLEAAFDCGINFFDTAYCYGADGISEILVGHSALARREQLVIATKCGIHWDENIDKVIDGSPDRLRKECNESLSRLQTDYVDLMYLHRPDPKIPISDSAGALLEMKQTGRTRTVGLSNCDLEQAKEFNAVCPLAAIQLPYNMLDRKIEDKLVPWCIKNKISLFVYWPLMKGLLAGKIRRDFQFEENDKRKTYSQFSGEQWERSQLLIDLLESIAQDSGHSIAELVINWTINQLGITSALCGAKRDWQIRETAKVITNPISQQTTDAVESAHATWQQATS